MPYRLGSKLRKQETDKIDELVKQNFGRPKKVLIAKACLMTGMRKQTVEEIFDLMETAEEIRNEDGIIYPFQQEFKCPHCEKSVELNQSPCPHCGKTIEWVEK